MRGKPFTKFAPALLALLSPAYHAVPALGRFSNAPVLSPAAIQQAGWAANSPGRGGPVTNGLRMFIEAQHAPFPQDQPIDVVFHVTNVGVVDFDFSWCRSTWEYNFRVDVATDRGDPVVRTERQFGIVSYTSGGIGPGEEHVEIGDIRDQYALGPGKYYLTATAGFAVPPDGSSWVHAVSNTIEITVAPAREKGSTDALKLGILQGQWVYGPPDAVTRGLRLSNSGDHDIQVASKQEQAWFHDVTLDLRTLAGEPVPRKRGADGHELLLDKDGAGPYDRHAFSRPIWPGANLDANLSLYAIYNLTPGTAYTLTAHLTLQTSGGPIELTSNTVTFAIKANWPN
jgi:hypothetical protein